MSNIGSVSRASSKVIQVDPFLVTQLYRCTRTPSREDESCSAFRRSSVELLELEEGA